MAKVVITLEDQDKGDSVNISWEFDPPLDNTENGKETSAQYMAARVLQSITKEIAGEDDNG